MIELDLIAPEHSPAGRCFDGEVPDVPNERAGLRKIPLRFGSILLNYIASQSFRDEENKKA
jgi:hypothetical protein